MVAYGLDIVVVTGEELVSAGSDDWGGITVGCPASLVETGMDWVGISGYVVVPVVGDIAGAVDDMVVSRGGRGRSGPRDVSITPNTSAPIATTPPVPATTIAGGVSYHGVCVFTK